MTRILLLVALALPLAAAGAGCSKRGSSTGASPLPAGKVPPSDGTLTACGYDGVEAAIGAAKGKVVVIDCWATWCGPCVESFPELVKKHEKYGPKGLAVISISLDDVGDAEDVEAFLKKRGATFTNIHLVNDAAGRKKMQAELGFKGSIPHAVLFDKQGKRVWAGHPMDPELEAKLVAELDR